MHSARLIKCGENIFSISEVLPSAEAASVLVSRSLAAPWLAALQAQSGELSLGLGDAATRDRFALCGRVHYDTWRGDLWVSIGNQRIVQHKELIIQLGNTDRPKLVDIALEIRRVLRSH